MKQVSAKNRYNTITIITFIIILLSFGYYYFAYVKNAEKRFHERAFRIIETVGKSIEKKQKNYNNIATNALSHIIKYDNASKRLIDEALIDNYFGDDYSVNSQEIDRILKNDYGVPKELNFLFTDKFLVDFDALETGSQSEERVKISKATSELIGDDIKFEIIIEDYIITVYYRKEALFQNTLRYDIFEEYFAFYESQNKSGNSKEKKLQLLYSDIPISFNNPVNYEKFDTILFEKNLLFTTSLFESDINKSNKLTYLTPLDIDPRMNFYLAGILDRNEFRKQTLNLNPIATTLLVVVMVLMILLFPILKLRLLSENERLNTSDSVLGFFAIVISSAFILLIILHQFTKIQTSNNFKEKYLSSSVKNIEESMISEFDVLLDSLISKDEMIKKPDLKRTQFIYDSKTKHKLDSKNINAFMWLNKKGDQLVKWADPITPRVNVSHRKYFKFPVASDQWKDESIAGGTDFYIESIRSITDGFHYLIFSKKSKNTQNYFSAKDKFTKQLASTYDKDDADIFSPSVVMMPVKELKSFTNFTSPENIHIMLIGKDGEVMFHENKNKILQENLMVETQNHPDLFTALQTHEDAFFITEYESKSSYFYLSPVGDLPIYLVAYVNNDYEKLVSAQIFGMSFTLFFLLFILIMAQIGIFVFIDSKHHKKTKNGDILFSWIWPHPENNSIYKLLILYNLACIIVFTFLGFSHHIFTSMMFFTLLINCNIFVLNRHRILKSNRGLNVYTAYFTAILLLVSLFLVISLTECYKDVLLIVGIIIFLILNLVVILWAGNLKKNKEEFFKPLYYNSLLFLIVLSFGILPASGFFFKSFNVEKEMYIRNMQFSFAQKADANGYENKITPTEFSITKLETPETPANIDTINTPVVDSTINVNTLVAEDTSALGPGLNDPVQKKEILDVKSNNQNELYNPLSPFEYSLYSNIRVPFSLEYRNASSYNFVNTNNISNLKWVSGKDKTTLEDNVNKYKITSNKLKFHWIPKAIYSNKPKAVFISFLVLVLCIVILLYFTISYWISKTFLLQLPHVQNFDSLELSKWLKYLYIISPPYSGIAKRLAEIHSKSYPMIIKIKDAGDMVFVEEKLNEIKKKKSKSIIIQDSETFTTGIVRIKTSLVAKLKVMVENEEIERVFIVSNTQPSYKFKLLYGENDKEKETNRQCFDNYLHTIGKFKRVFYPLPHTEEYFLVSKNENKKSSRHLAYFNPELMKRNDLDTWIKMQEGAGDAERILNEQSLYQVYYLSIWHSLEDREKYLLYDLAQDGLANYKNINIINDLIQKGILTYKKLRLQFFSHSFKSFILTNIDRDESLLIELQARHSGNWSNLRLPLMMIILALFIFLVMTQQDKVNAVLGWIATSVASLPILIKVLSGFTNLMGSKSKAG
ncbi:MAG: hypothetical protein K9G76_12040 [Bacteroidales bacterium]|nr:hypothetical protein [Bacteroidales bacterium]MCF8405258.1 hypothetical protein [Bacteroidales bacterium]